MAKITEEDVLKTAKERFERSVEFWSDNYEKMKEDIRFAAASPDDPWQWEEDDRTARNGRPMLTINKMPQHIRQVTNDIRQNRPAIRYRPADSKADPEVADMLMGVARHIEANSDADVAYDTAADMQVTAGLGYIRVLTDYIRDDSFDQDIFIGHVEDTFRCWDDPDAIEPAGADRKWFFYEDSLSEEDFKRQYPDAEAIDWVYAGRDDDWFTGDKRIRIVEYFEIVEKPATLQLWANGATSYKGDPLPDGVIPGEVPLKERRTTKCLCVWRKLNGQQILEGGPEGKEFPCRYIPWARVVGNVYKVDGKLVISGLVRNAKDSQRMYNVAQSAIVERVMLAPKAPWTGPAEAFEGYEEVWRTANTRNHSFLPYNHITEGGEIIPPPARTAPATIEPGLSQIALGAADDIKSETGQYDASLGQKSNETSGRAIMARQREGDNATYHYVDNLARAVRHIGRIILDMIPHVYDTERVARIIGEDGEQTNATINPNNPEPLSELRDEAGEIQRIFNPNIGTYDVYTTTGPSFTTRRMEAVEAMTQMTQANPQLWQVIGDLLVKNMDWPGAEDMAKRLKVTLLPAVQKEVDADSEQQVPPQVQAQIDQQQETIQQLDQVIQELQPQIEGKQIEAEKVRIDAYKAETDRMKVEGELALKAQAQAVDPEALKQFIEQQSNETKQMILDIMHGVGMIPQTPPMEEPPPEQIQAEQPPSGGFFSPQEPEMGEPAPELPPA